MLTDYAQQSWGVYVNSTSYSSARSIPEDCLTWVKPVGKDRWQKRGVVVWHNEAQKVEVMSAGYALQLLEYMHTNDTWKENGIPISRQCIQLLPADTPKKKQSRKKDENQPPIEEKESESETVIKECFHLTAQESTQLLQILEANEPSLRQMADEDEKTKSRIQDQLLRLLVEGGRRSEGKGIDFSARPFKWEQAPDKLNWICDRPPNRGSAVVTEDYFFWRGCIERPDRFKHWSSYFGNLQEALSWVEQELEKVEQEIDEVIELNPWKRVPMADLIAQRREKLADYWIEPFAMEPKRVTYRAIIDLEYEPYDYKTWEMSFGKKCRHSEKFASPTQLARELQLDPQLDIEQLISGWYRLLSRVIYYREDIAIAQAQQFWEKSTIVQQHRAGKVVRAQYGYEEVGICYRVMIGGCENPERPYPLEKSREEHLERLALRETLIYALDLEGFRLFLGLSPGDISDEKLLNTMHTQRADSPHVPLEAQMESERWLRTYGTKRVLRKET